ncbi:MAG: hypothetical protein M3Q68_01250 [Actinomycetota bacterium]|nr:hypothetical protein [Actinomycetota bacterium]
MARDTLSNAKAEIVAELEAAQASFGGAPVFGYQPPVDHLNDGVAVCVFTVGATPTSWRIGVRLLITATVAAADAQALIDDWMPAVVAALSSHYGPEDWVTEFPTEDAPYYAATNVLEVGREDF